MQPAVQSRSLFGRQHQEIRRMKLQMVEKGLRRIIPYGSDFLDLDAQRCDGFLRAAVPQQAPLSQDRPDPREILEVLSGYVRIDVHDGELGLHDQRQFECMDERRLAGLGEIGRMENVAMEKRQSRR
jgi:hypothetical protein